MPVIYRILTFSGGETLYGRTLGTSLDE